MSKENMITDKDIEQKAREIGEVRSDDPELDALIRLVKAKSKTNKTKFKY